MSERGPDPRGCKSDTLYSAESIARAEREAWWVSRAAVFLLGWLLGMATATLLVVLR